MKQTLHSLHVWRCIRPGPRRRQGAIPERVSDSSKVDLSIMESLTSYSVPS